MAALKSLLHWLAGEVIGSDLPPSAAPGRPPQSGSGVPPLLTHDYPGLIALLNHDLVRPSVVYPK